MITKIKLITDIEEEEEGLFKIAKIKPITDPATAMPAIRADTGGATGIGEMFTPEGIASRLKSKTYRTGEKEISELVKPKEPTRLTPFESALGTWEEQKAANPELQKTEDLAKEVLSIKGINSSHKDAQIAYVYELLTTTETEAGVPMEETIKDIQANKEKYGSINPPVNWKKSWKEGKLKTIFVGPSTKYGQAESMLRGFEDILIKKESPGADKLSSIGFKGMVLLMGAQAVAGAIDITPQIWNKLKVKVTNRAIPYAEGREAMNKVDEPTVYGQPTVQQRRIWDELIKKADIEKISMVDMLKKGISITDVQPRFAFGGAKLYSGLPADEIAKSIVEVGKVTAEVVKGLEPVKVSQITQQLLNTSPALASEFLKAVEKPEGIPEPAKVTPPTEPKEVLKAGVKEPDTPLDIEENELIDMDNKPVELNEDGTITLYHRTTPKSKAKIMETGDFVSKENRNETFFSTKLDGQSVGYGEAVIAIKVDPKVVRLNDAFHGGDISVAVSNKKLSKEMIVPKATPKAPAIPAELEGLAEEAKPIKVYQGGGKTLKVEDRIGGMYLTKSKEYAQKFAGKSGEIAEGYVSPKKPYDLTDEIENQPERELLIESPENFPNEIKRLKEEGYDAITYKDQILALDPSIVKPPPTEPEEVLKAEVKEPVKVELSENKIIPTTIEEAKEILKVDPKKPLIAKELLAKKMVEKKISLADMEAVKGEKIDVKNPRDIIIALKDINAVKKEVVVEPIPKATPKAPAIPKELEGLAEEARKYKSAEEFSEAITKKTESILPKGTSKEKDFNFISRNGELLKNVGKDHNVTVSKILNLDDYGKDNIRAFLNSGNIRADLRNNELSLNIGAKPTEEQLKTINDNFLKYGGYYKNDIFVDIEQNGEIIESKKFEATKYKPEEVINYIKDNAINEPLTDFYPPTTEQKVVVKEGGGKKEVLYRGQKPEFKEVQKVANSDAMDNILLGRGVFTTTDKSVAESYGKNILEFQKPSSEDKVFDLTKATDKELKSLLPESFFNEKIIDKTAYETYKELIKDNKIAEAEDVIVEALASKYLPEGISWEEAQTGGDWVTSEKQTPEYIRDKIISDLKNEGYNWWKHKGGLRAGKIEHDVYVALSDDVLKPAPAPVAEKPKVEGKAGTPPVKAEVEPEIELASPAQINKAYSIAKAKAMVSEEGKLKPQFRKIAEIFTGVKYIEKMTPEQAEMFIDQLNRLPEPKYRNGKLVAPSIPRTTKLTIQDFFKKQYGEPTPIWLLTDQTYYATKLGIKPLVEPFEKGKQEFDLEFRKSSNLVDRMVNKLNQVAKTPIQEKLKAKVKNIPTKAESKMAELLNKHEATPTGLSPKEEDIFKYFRNLSKDIWRRENEVREKLDLPPIKYKTAYFRHTADAMAKEMLEGKYPFPQGIKYWSEKIVGKKIFNPMEFHRKLSDDLIDLWSKDIRAVAKAMLWNGLKEIHLAEPAKYLNEQLNAISKDLPEYKNLTPTEQKAYDQTKVIPASTKKWLIDYINQVIKGQETELDASLNRIVTKSGLKGIFDKVLCPFGRAIGRTPITNLSSLSGRMVISGVMGWVPRQIIRNAFQQVQNLALYGVEATIKSFLPASIDKNLKGLLNESLFMKSYTGFEELPVDLMGKLEKVWLTPYGIVAVNNAKQGMKAAYWNILELIKSPKYKKYGWADPQRTKDTPKGFLYPSEKEKLLKEMEFGSSCTQYQYIPMAMPGVFRYKALIPLTRLQSWWMNYFAKFNTEAFHRLKKGETSYGAKLPWSRRVNWAKYLIIGGAILTAMGYKRSFMLGVLPGYLSPAGQLGLGFYNYTIADSDWQKKMALNQIYYSWKAFIPGSLAWRDFLAVWNGEKDLEEILFYGKTEEKKKAEPIVIGKPSVSKITIPKISKIKINKISPTKVKF